MLFALVVAVLHPRVFRWITTRVFKPFGGVEMPDLPYRVLLGLLVFYAFSWVVGGAAFLFLIRAVGGNSGADSIVFLGGTAAVGAIVAVLSMIAPSGLGVREASMYGLVLAVTSSGVALGAVVLNRIAITLVEALLLFGALLWRHRRARPRGTRDPVTGSSASSARRRPARPTSRRRSPTGCPESSSRRTRCRRTAACRSSRTSRSGRRGSRDLAARREPRSPSTRSSRTPRSTTLLAKATPIVVGGTGLYLRAALGGLELPPPPAPARGSGSRRCTTSSGPRPRTPSSPRARRGCGRQGAPERPPARRPRARARRGGRVARAATDTLWGDGYRHRTLVVALDVPRDVLAERIEARTRSMVERGVVEEARAALGAAISRTASTIHGLRDFAELPLDEAVETYNGRVRRYAAYQRKWMRRIPGVVIIDANRPATEVADEIVELARARERLPGDGAVRADA